MSYPIRDGTGTGYHAKVDAANRLRVFSVEENVQQHATGDGDAYNINTGAINLTNAAETPLLYVKNNETRDLVITALAVGVGASDGTAGEEISVKLIKNPTAGTIVSGASAVSVKSNRNFGSSGTLSADAYKGATGSTMTDGSDHALFYAQEGQRLYVELSEVIPQGKSIGVKLTPPPSNTDVNVYVAVICHLRDAASV